jgi:cytochrome c-type biogenesis protein
MFSEIGLLAAFAAGFLSFISPCHLALVPIFIAYLTGVSTSQHEGVNGKPSRLPLAFNALCFILGFTAVFVLLGASVGFITSGLSGSQIWLARIGGALIITFGLVSLGLLKVPALLRSYTISGKLPAQNVRYLGSFIVGATIGVGWTPCVGPILGSILVLAGTTGSAAKGMLLLLAFSIGMMIPFLMIGFFAEGAMNFVRAQRRLFHHAERVAGVLLIGLGIIVFTDRLRDLASYLFIPTI